MRSPIIIKYEAVEAEIRVRFMAGIKMGVEIKVSVEVEIKVEGVVGIKVEVEIKVWG